MKTLVALDQQKLTLFSWTNTNFVCNFTDLFLFMNKRAIMTKENRVTIKRINNIAQVRLNRPDKHNGLDMAMFRAIDKAIKTLKRDRTIRVIIVSGEGPDFCTGLDIKSVMKSVLNPVRLLFKIRPWRSNLAQRVSTGWKDISTPVIMAIHGRCWGGGLQIALGADIRIVTPDASLSILEGRWGLIPDMGGTLALRELITVDVAKQLVMTAAFIDGNKALELGLVTEVDEQPLEKAQQLAEVICQQSPDTVAAVKKLYNKSWHGIAGVALLRESYYQLKILLGKNSKIKSYNQSHDKSEQKSFVTRQRW